MVLGGQEKHRILGRMYSDDQLFRIIVPKRYTLHAYPPIRQVEAGFSKKRIITSGDIRPNFTDEDIALVLRYRWPEDLEDVKACDIDAVNHSVGGVGSNLKSEADTLSYDDVTLSDYCHEKLYNDKALRDHILDSFKAELHEAREFRTAAIEIRLKRTEPGVLQYIIVARIHHALSWTSIAVSLNRLCRGLTGLESHFNNFDGDLVREIFQLHAEARTTIFEDCVRRDWRNLSWPMERTGRNTREAQGKRIPSPVTPAKMTLAESRRGLHRDTSVVMGGHGK